LQRLEQAGVITNPASALGSLRSLRIHLDMQPQQRLMNAYLHVTDACNLACRHCYAESQKPATPLR
jgi:sulfatase maturation enzyme AslB (radical SAM superfamily)